jgi:hypothetical protein
VGLSATRLAIARPAALWPGKARLCEIVECDDLPHAEPWRPAINSLAEFIARQTGPKIALSVTLSGQFTRWQLLPWTPELSQGDELASYARLRFGQTFGPVAETWQILRVAQPPGKTVPVCAVDAELVAVLRNMCSSADIRLVEVRPYFSAAFDRWRGDLKATSVWFGAVEPDCISLGLLEGGSWSGLRVQRIDDDWRNVLPGMMAQVGMATGQGGESPRLYLAGVVESQASSANLPFVRLSPSTPMHCAQLNCCLALGV